LFSDEDSSDVQFEIVFSSMVIGVEIVRDSVGNVQDGVEDDFTIGVEMDPVHWGIGLFAQAFVKIDVIFFINVVLVFQPQGLVSVDLLPFINCFLDFLGFLFFLFFSLLDFEVLFSVGLFDFDGLLDLYLFFVVQVNGEIDEF
jgi:hypothetical protein